MSAEKNPTTGLTVDVFGPQVEFLLSPQETQNGIRTLKVIMPPKGIVPLHSHPDVEDFIVISGEMQCLKDGSQGGEWIVAHAGDYVHVPEGTRHAWRNISNEPAVLFVITTQHLENFFKEAGRPATSALEPPTPEAFGYFARLCAKYDYWLASPQENAAVGISLGF